MLPYTQDITVFLDKLIKHGLGVETLQLAGSLRFTWPYPANVKSNGKFNCSGFITSINQGTNLWKNQKQVLDQHTNFLLSI